MAVPVKILADTLFSYSANFSTSDPHIAALADGRFYLVSTLADSSGDLDASGMLVSLNPDSGLSQGGYIIAGGTFGDTVNHSQASVDGISGRKFVGAWTETPTSTGLSDIRGEFFTPNGGGSSGSFLVNVGNTAGNQVRPEAVALNGGSAAFAWVDLATSQIKASVFDQYGNAVISNMTVNQTANATNFFGGMDLGLTALSNGAFVVSWLGNGFSQDYIRIGSSLGFFLPEIAIPGTGSTDVAALADGRFAVTYFRSGGHFARIYDAFGNLSVAEFQVSSSFGFQSVTGLQDGRFIIVYDDNDEIWGQIWNADGSAGSDKFKINSDASGGNSRPYVEALAEGTVAVSWEQATAGGPDIFFTILDPREAGVSIAGTESQDRYTGSRFNDVFVLGDASDVVDGKDGNDQLFGGLGTDQLYGGAGGDTLDGGVGNDILSGGAGNDTIVGGAGFDTADFAGMRSAYTINVDGTQVSGPDGVDTLSGVERFTFDNMTLTRSVAIIPDITVPLGEWVPLSSRLSYSDQDGNPAVQYQFLDAGLAANSGYLWTADVGQRAANEYVTIAAADLATTWVRGGAASGSETMWLRAFDGTLWSDWDSFTLTSTNNLPVAVIGNQTLGREAWEPLANWLSYSDADADPAVQYQFFDAGMAGNSGYLWTADIGQRAANAYVTIAAADLATTWVRAGAAAGSETMWVRAYDGHEWGNWDAFGLTTL